MSFMDLAAARYSVRRYMDKPIEEEKLAAIRSVARLAPTAHNNQPQKVYVVESEEARAKLASVCKCTFGAPVILVVCYDPEVAWHNKLMPGYQSGETDAAIVCTHMMMEAWELGLGSCWVGMFSDEQVRQVLNLPDNLRVSALLPIGYAAEDAVPAPLHDQYRSEEDLFETL
ncbi:MAG: nitroreductase [Ruminococcaceae bacterium]|nr:nitroreductase [Oscillospiraceae bacterium]